MVLFFFILSHWGWEGVGYGMVKSQGRVCDNLSVKQFPDPENLVSFIFKIDIG